VSSSIYIVSAARSGGQLLAEQLGKDANWGQVDYSFDNCLRVGELASQNPDAKFIFVARAPGDAISSTIQAWLAGGWVTHPQLEGWWGEPWSFALLPHWSDLIGSPIAEIATEQFLYTSEQAIAALKGLDGKRWAAVHFEALIAEPEVTIATLADKFGVTLSVDPEHPLPPSAGVIATSGPQFVKRNMSEISAALANKRSRLEKINEFREGLGPIPEKISADSEQRPSRPEPQPSKGTPFSSSYSTSVVELLTKAKSSLLVSTYKSGHLITVRSDGETINTAFRSMRRPMGVAVAGTRLAVGTEDTIATYANQRGLANRLGLSGADAVFAPRNEQLTGDIAIHDMAYGTTAEDRALYFVNTRFSCLCTQDFDYSWVPVWRPKWITEYSGEDRCHLNGLAMVDGKPRYVTALSQSNEPNGWRQHKGTSGVLIDITDDRVVASGLSMPHSPRWHDGQLWVLESGKGSLARVDVETGGVTTVAVLPGFTRGLSFIGRYALVGLSQVRESVFKALPVTSQKAERNCGVWIVDTQSGEIMGMLKFDGAVQEIFEVAVIQGSAWPEIIDREEGLQNSYVLPGEVAENFKGS
jgi:uncharacterized protein (TIGR03032 family)